jgi:hypothetical protein
MKRWLEDLPDPLVFGSNEQVTPMITGPRNGEHAKQNLDSILIRAQSERIVRARKPATTYRGSVTQDSRWLARGLFAWDRFARRNDEDDA